MMRRHCRKARENAKRLRRAEPKDKNRNAKRRDTLPTTSTCSRRQMRAGRIDKEKGRKRRPCVIYDTQEGKERAVDGKGIEERWLEDKKATRSGLVSLSCRFHAWEHNSNSFKKKSKDSNC